MTVPGWLSALVAEFGKGAGLPGLAFNDRGAAAIKFENGDVLRFEYSPDVFAVMLTVPAQLDLGRAKALLTYAHPKSMSGFHVRAGYLRKGSEAVFAIKFGERDVTMPVVNRAFSVLWRIAQEFGGAS